MYSNQRHGNELTITAIPALADNYIWVIAKQNDGVNEAVIVDPGESAAVLRFLSERQLKPKAIWLTHNHSDHTDGVAAILAVYPELSVLGSSEVQAFCTEIVSPEQSFSLWGESVQVLDSAGHTAKHISYLLAARYLFCGDALFSGGCGRTIDYAAQFETLQRFHSLPDHVAIYAGHEYTQNNLKFAETVLPPSCWLAEMQERADMLRAQGKPTLPSQMGIEKQINPFLRAQNLAEFTRLRQQKDRF